MKVFDELLKIEGLSTLEIIDCICFIVDDLLVFYIPKHCQVVLLFISPIWDWLDAKIK